MRAYVTASLQVSYQPDVIDVPAVWIDFPGEATPKAAWQLTPALAARLEAKLAVLREKVARRQADPASLKAAEARWPELQAAIATLLDPEAVRVAREALKALQGRSPPLAEPPECREFPGWPDLEPGHLEKWVAARLMKQS